MVRSTRSVIPIRASFEQIRARAITTRKLGGRSLRNQLTVAAAVQLFNFSGWRDQIEARFCPISCTPRAVDCS